MDKLALFLGFGLGVGLAVSDQHHTSIHYHLPQTQRELFYQPLIPKDEIVIQTPFIGTIKRRYDRIDERVQHQHISTNQYINYHKAIRRQNPVGNYARKMHSYPQLKQTGSKTLGYKHMKKKLATF